MGKCVAATLNCVLCLSVNEGILTRAYSFLTMVVAQRRQYVVVL